MDEKKVRLSSDGRHSPSELVALAKERGIEVLALTDHDATDGVAEAAVAEERLGVRVIPSVELSAREYHTFHILGYAYDLAAPTMVSMCARTKAGWAQSAHPRLFARKWHAAGACRG